MGNFREVKPGGRPFKRLYLAVMLWIVGRAIQASARVDPEVKREFEELPEGFTFTLGALPAGPEMVVGKDADGNVRYMGRNSDGKEIHVKMTIKSIEAFFLLFTFQESTPVANARDRLFVDGGLPEACAVVRVLDVVQVYLLPSFIAKLAVKRYPRWSLKRHTAGRMMVYLRTFIGF